MDMHWAKTWSMSGWGRRRVGSKVRPGIGGALRDAGSVCVATPAVTVLELEVEFEKAVVGSKSGESKRESVSLSCSMSSGGRSAKMEGVGDGLIRTS